MPYKISISIIILMILFISGCVKIPPSTTETREETKKLESIPINKGTIVDITFINGHDLTQIKFSDGGVVLCGYYWKNRKDIKIGQTGTLFVSNNHDKKHCHCQTCWWSWKENVSNKETTKIIPTENKKQKANIIDGEWQSLITSPPEYKTVLVKFKNGLVTTGYITSTGDWKSEMDRKKLSGGIALKNVSQWKLVDLE